MIEKILNKIDEYECICLYRHVNPDYDAFGSQFGMYDLIQNTFENKEVYFAGDFSSDLVAKYQFNGEINEPNFEKPTLNKEKTCLHRFINLTNELYLLQS